MKLSNFERSVSKKILTRGKTYYHGGAVQKLTKVGVNEWNATVKGSLWEEYRVSVLIEGDEVQSWGCSCPYDWGDVCKHVVATLFEIREEKGWEDEEDADYTMEKSILAGKNVEQEELMPRFKKLSDTEQRAVKIGAMIWESFSQTKFIEVFKKTNFKFHGINLYPKDAKPLLKKLVNQGFFTLKKGEYRCVKSFAHQLCERFFNKDADFRRIVHAIRATYKQSTWYYNHTPIDYFRDMRLSRYMNEPDVFRRSYFGLINHNASAHTQESLLEYWLPKNFDLDRLESLPDRIRAFLLSEKLTIQTFDLLPSDGYFHYTVSKVASMHMQDSLYITRLAAQIYLLQGNWKGLERMLSLTQPSSAENLRGIWRLLHGDTNGALQSFDAAIKIIRKDTNNRKEVLNNLPGIFQILAQLKTLDNAWLPKIKKHTAQIGKNYSSYGPVYQWLDAVRHFLLNEKRAAIQILKSQKNNLFLLYFFKFFCDFWVDEKLVDRQRLQKFYHKVSANGYDWLAAETLALWNKLEPGDEEREIAQAAYLQKLGAIDPLYQLLPRIEEWENALKVLLHLGSTKRKTASQNDARLAWLVDFTYSRVMAKQQSFGKNGWTKGRPVAYHRLRARELECITDHDSRIIQAIGYGDGTELRIRDDKVWKQLCNHPLLFLWKSPTTAVQLLEGQLHMSVQEDGDGYRVSLSQPVTEKGVQIIKETPTRYLVIDVDDQLWEIARALNSKALFVPEKGADRLKEAVAGLSGIVSVQSVFEDDNLPAVEPDSRLHLHLLPVGDGFHVELYVKPFRDTPPYVKPGEGEPTLIALLDGQRTSTTRDMKAEKKEVLALRSRVPILDERRPHKGIWELEEAEQCLQLLLQIDPIVQAGDIVLEWPKGEKFRISKVAEFDQLRLDIRGKGHWFEVEGELAVDENTVLNMQQLLTLSEQQGQFIELSQGKFLALTEEFRRRLREAAGLLKPQKKGGPLQLHPLAAPALDGFISSLKYLQTDQSFQEARERLETAFSKKYRLSKKFKATLRAYQREGFEWLHRCAAWGVGACLADDMGLGKTIQALAVLTNRAKLGPALVVAPASVCRNWRAETQKFAPALRPLLFGEGDRKTTIEKAKKGDLVIVTYDLMTREHDLFVNKEFATIILDEAQAIKNRATKRSETAMQLQADFKMILTGTPLENHLGELWNLFQFINPGLLGTIEQFNEQFTLPIEKYQDKDRREQLRKLVQPFILRRRKSEVLKELPEKTEVTLTVELPPEERAFYEALRRNAIQKLTSDTDNKGGEKHLRILAELMRLRRAACHPSLANVNSGFTSSAKLRLFAEIVEELLENGHKALVFSQFVGHLKILEAHLKENGISYQYLDGQTPLPKRQQRIEAFQAGEGDLFLISLKAGGVGLNLTAADYVIHTDPWWNPAVEDQATDRAHRIGQEKPVTVYRLVAENTIEEKILMLHEQKRDLADSLLAGTDVSAKMTADDLLALMQEG